MMTKQRLVQYRKLKHEIEQLEDRILAAENGGELVTDYAKDYTTGYPRIITLRGYGSQAVPRLSAKLARCVAECQAVEQFVDSVEDSTLRQLLDLHFLEGMTWDATAKRMGYSDDHLKRLFSAFIK